LCLETIEGNHWRCRIAKNGGAGGSSTNEIMVSSPRPLQSTLMVLEKNKVKFHTTWFLLRKFSVSGKRLGDIAIDQQPALLTNNLHPQRDAARSKYCTLKPLELWIS